LRKIKEEKHNEKIFSDYIHLFICFCLQQRLDQKAATGIYALFNSQGGALGKP
jgi:hypothetical protein